MQIRIKERNTHSRFSQSVPPASVATSRCQHWGCSFPWGCTFQGVYLKPYSQLMSAFASNFKNGIYGNKWWYSFLTFKFDSKDQRKTQMQKLSVNKALHVYPPTSQKGPRTRHTPQKGSVTRHTYPPHEEPGIRHTHPPPAQNDTHL